VSRCLGNANACPVFHFQFNDYQVRKTETSRILIDLIEKEKIIVQKTGSDWSIGWNRFFERIGDGSRLQAGKQGFREAGRQ
jgi:hypothetical protein